MTDAFLCDGCDEFYHERHRFVGLKIDVSAVRNADFIIDDLPVGTGSLVDRDDRGELCTECGRKALEALVEALYDGPEGGEDA